MITNDVIDELLSVKGMTKRELTRKLGLTNKQFKLYEGNGYKTMKMKDLTKMAWILGVPYGFFNKISRYDNFTEKE